VTKVTVSRRLLRLFVLVQISSNSARARGQFFPELGQLVNIGHQVREIFDCLALRLWNPDCVNFEGARVRRRVCQLSQDIPELSSGQFQMMVQQTTALFL
jgi:hypothetical protein